MKYLTIALDRHREIPLKEGETTKPGDFAWSFDSPLFSTDNIYLYVHLPDGYDTWHAIKVARGHVISPDTWSWDGNVEKPTLSPSINVPGKWHGYIKNGVAEACE